MFGGPIPRPAFPRRAHGTSVRAFDSHRSIGYGRTRFKALQAADFFSSPDFSMVGLAAIGWLELGNYSEANEELKKIASERRAHLSSGHSHFISIGRVNRFTNKEVFGIDIEEGKTNIRLKGPEDYQTPLKPPQY